MFKLVYLGAKQHRLLNVNCDVSYNDIVAYPGIDLLCDMLQVDLSQYDIIIATPPCNYYSHANWRFDSSIVSLKTRHLLPNILAKLCLIGKPFLVENAYSKRCPTDFPCFIYRYGHHIFYTNILLPISYLPKYQPLGIQNKFYGARDNNINVHRFIYLFLKNLGVYYGELD